MFTDYIKREFTVQDVIYSLIGLYPGMNSQIFAMARVAEQEARNKGLTGMDLVNYVDYQVREQLD